MLIALQDITFEFGARTIVEDATWHIMPNERIGLIGLNGTGKSTLLRIINGEYTISSGSIHKIKNLSIGFFNQDLMSFETDESILHVAMTAFERALKLEKEIEEITQKLEHSEEESLLHAFSDKLHEFEALDGYNIKHKAEAILEGLGFSTADLQRAYNEFSGGWRMRVLLARMILQKPDVLMLDEPTNHLDLPSIEWLERYLGHYEGTVIIVSHDRYFLDRMVTKIVELYQSQLHDYSGNYSFYEKEKTQRVELQKRAYENQQDYIRQQERFIERFRAKATKAAQAQSAIKRLGRLERIEEVDGGPAKININFTIDKSPGKILCTLREVSKRFGNIEVIRDANATIERGDKIGLIGANGKGKSTLLRMIAGTENFEGERIPGHNVVQSFYAQHQLEALHLENDILDELKGCGSGKTELELRSLLGCFLFSGDDVFKKIKILSGGEKARVALAKTIISQANFLLLDEPTNHLDIHSVQMLIEALNKYSGSFILVSHDRYFVQETANKIWEIEEGRITEFAGSYAEWEEWKQQREAKKLKEERSPDNNTPELTKNKSGNEPVMSQPVAAPSRDAKADKSNKNGGADKEAKRELQKQQRLFKSIEDKIALLNKRKSQLEQDLTNPAIYADRQKFLLSESTYNGAVKELEDLNKEYEAAFEKLIELNGE